MANVNKKRSVTVDVAEATKIHKLLEADLSANFDTMKSDIKALTASTTSIAKWSDIVDDLNAPTTAPPATVAENKPGGDALAAKSAAPKK